MRTLCHLDSVTLPTLLPAAVAGSLGRNPEPWIDCSRNGGFEHHKKRTTVSEAHALALIQAMGVLETILPKLLGSSKKFQVLLKSLFHSL